MTLATQSGPQQAGPRALLPQSPDASNRALSKTTGQIADERGTRDSGVEGGDGSIFNRSVSGSVHSAALTNQKQEMDKLVARQIYFTKKIEKEQTRYYEAVRRLDEIRAAVLKRSKKMAGKEGTAAEGRQRALKQSRANKLENKIQRMTVAINSTNASNAALKKKIDDLRLERINYRETLQKAVREGERRKAAVVRLNRQTTDTREQAEYVMREYEKLKTQTIEELDNFNREFEALRVEMPHPVDASNVPVLSLSPIHRPSKASPEKHAFDHDDTHGAKTKHGLTKGVAAMLHGDEHVAGDSDHQHVGTADERELRQSLNKAYWVVAKDRVDYQKDVDMKKELTDAFNRIKDQTGVSSLQELLGAYLTEEEANFKTYQLINKLNAELDAQESAKTATVEEIASIEQRLTIFQTDQLIDKLEELKEGLDAQESAKTATAKTALVEAIAEIEQRLREQCKNVSLANSSKIAEETERTQRQKETLETNYQSDLKVIADIEESMASLVKTLIGDDAGHVDTVGELLIKGGVSEGTLAKFLGYIEGKMTALMQIAEEESENDVTKAPMPKIGADGVRECSIEMPIPPSTTEDVDEMEEDSPMPVDVQAIKESLLQPAERTDGGEPNDASAGVRSGSVRSNRKMSRSGSRNQPRKMSMGGAKGLNYMQGSPKHRNSLLMGTGPSSPPKQAMADRSTSHGSLNNM